MMEIPFKNGPFAMIYQAFKRLYPDKQCEIWLDIPQDDEIEKKAYGMTNSAYYGGMTQVFAYPKYLVHQKVENLIHELAHIAVGPEHDHDEVWNSAFEDIFREYNKIRSELFGENKNERKSI